MQPRWQRIRPIVWTLTPIVGVALLFLLPWLIREMRPLRSDALFQEARVELGAAHTRYPDAVASYVRALVHAGNLAEAQAFVQALPRATQPCAQQELIRALIDIGELDRALKEARKHLQTRNRSPCWSGSNDEGECLYWYLADELIAAGRLEDAATVIEWAKTLGSNQASEAYRLLARRAAETGRLDLALQVLNQIPAQDASAETLLVVQALLKQGQVQHAFSLLNHQLRQVKREDDTVRLPAALEATVQQVARLARAGRSDAAAQLAEQTIRRYLRTHTHETIAYDRLYTLAARFTEHLPAATMERILRRLPTDEYECAATHLRGGYIIGLLNTGRWSDLVRVLETPSGHSELPHLPRAWLQVAGYLQAGKVERAQAWLQASPLLDPKRAVRDGLQSLQQQLPSLTPEVADAIERLATEWVLGARFLHLPSKVVGGSVRDAVTQGAEITVYPVIVAGSRRRFGDAVTLTAWSLHEGIERTLNDMLIYEAAFHLGLDHSQLDALLRISDPNDTVYWAKGLGAVAQAGRLEDAEAILRAAPSSPEYGMDFYRAGYAIGLAKRGRFREAVRMARRLPHPVYRVHALAAIAAELKKRGM